MVELELTDLNKNVLTVTDHYARMVSICCNVETDLWSVAEYGNYYVCANCGKVVRTVA